MRILGLICARGGSKGIPDKNIKMLKGKPLIAYAIEAGLASQHIERVVVSTDSEKIAEIAKKHNADVPFIRPKELASDKSLQIDAINHALTTLKEQGHGYDAIALLQPTCPLRTADDIDGALSLLKEKKADTVISVTKVSGYHPITMYKNNENSTLSPLLPANESGVLRQNFQTILWRNGAIYAIRANILLENKTLYGPKLYGYEMPEERSANIDEPLDWLITEALMDYNMGQKDA